MNIAALKLFKHLAGTLHFGRTSQACNVTPSALTRTIQRLEDEIGSRLFVRDNRSVSLTAAGERFKLYADEVLQGWQSLHHDLAAEEAVLKGDISLYCSVTAVLGILPQILGKFRQTHPLVSIHLQTGDAASALSKLQNKEVDVVIAALPAKLPDNLLSFPIMQTPLIFIAPIHGTGRLSRLNHKLDWDRMAMIVAERGLERQILDAWFKSRDIKPNIYAQVAGNEAIIAMVSLGCGIGVVPQLVLDKSPLKDQIQKLKVEPDLSPIDVGICTSSKNMTNAIVQAFWSIARETARDAILSRRN